jgi:predicted  nucleic acid-binding Zn-ribbon protein
MDQNIISVERVKEVFDQLENLRDVWSEKMKALEKIKIAFADNKRCWETYNNRLAELQKETPDDVKTIYDNLENLNEEGNALTQMSKQVLLELETLNKNIKVREEEVIAVCAAIKELSKLFTERKIINSDLPT